MWIHSEFQPTGKCAKCRMNMQKSKPIMLTIPNTCSLRIDKHPGEFRWCRGTFIEVFSHLFVTNSSIFSGQYSIRMCWGHVYLNRHVYSALLWYYTLHKHPEMYSASQGECGMNSCKEAWLMLDYGASSLKIKSPIQNQIVEKAISQFITVQCRSIIEIMLGEGTRYMLYA